MKGKTSFYTNQNHLLIQSHENPIILNVGDVIYLEHAPNGKPLLAKYKVTTKNTLVALNGYVYYEYELFDSLEETPQQYFLH